MEIVTILLILRFIGLPLFAFWFYIDDLESSLWFTAFSFIPVIGEILLFEYIKEKTN